MATEVLIIWPGADEAGRLHEALLRSGLGIRARILEFYPDRQRLAETTGMEGAPDAVVVGMGLEERALQLIRDVRAASTGTLAIAVHTSASSELLRAVMQAGASDFLTPPFSETDIQRAFGPIAERSDPRPIGRLVVVSPCQGGDGASTVALHLAQYLSSLLERPALMVDCDVQCGVAAFRLSQTPKYTLADVLANVDRLDEFLSKIIIQWKNAHVILAPDSALGLLGEHMDRLPRALALARRSYPAVIADLPPGLYSSALEVSKRADEIYLVCTPEVTSLHLARRRINDLLRNDVDKARIRVVLNRCGSYRALPQSDVEQVLGIEVHHSISNDYEAVTAADMAGGLVSSESRLGHDLKALAKRVAGTEPEQPPPTSNWKRLLRIG